METDKEPEPGGSRKSIMLNLDQKSNIFVADQTPTPTRLIKNCDEVGLFDDLRNVNPFDETFRRAVEGVNPSVATAVLSDSIPEDSLHTPQVFPQLESNAEMLAKSLETPPIASTVTLDVPAVVEELLTDVDGFKTTSRQNSGSSTCFGFGKLQKYRNSVEKTSAAAASTPTTPIAANSTAHDQQSPVVLTPLQSTAPTTIQLLQPQVYTLNIPLAVASNGTTEEGHLPPPLSSYPTHSCHAIPVQTVKPFILPKIAASKTPPQHSASLVIPPSESKPIEVSSAITSQPYPAQPSHANLTPTSQLPIKERLKAILNFNSKSREKCLKSPVKVIKSRPKRSALNCDSKYDDDCIERRRAASTRYRVKMRNEYKLLRQRNLELQAENEKLRQRVRQLEQQQQQVPVYQPLSDCNGNVVQPNVPVHLQIPPSTVHVLMSIPNLIVPANGRPVLMPAPYTNNAKN